MGEKQIITIGAVVKRKMADTEDLFATVDYVSRCNAVFAKRIKVADFRGTALIVGRIADKKCGDCHEHNPRRRSNCLRPQSGAAPHSDSQLDAFEALFRRINGGGEWAALLPPD